MIRRLFRPLDRYVFGEFFKIFVSTAIGFPLLVIIIDLTENLQKYMSRNLPRRDVALSYLYMMPDSMFMVLPASVLFATVFAIGGFTRHSEITAAKASGISFYRLIMPIFACALLATGIDLVLAEVSPVTSARRDALLDEQKFRSGTTRFNFAYAGEYGRVYKVRSLDTQKGVMEALQIERKGKGPDYPTYLLDADSATYAAGRGWTLRKGEMDVVLDADSATLAAERGGARQNREADVARDSTRVFSIVYASMRDKLVTDPPLDMMARPRIPQEMRYQELSRFIAAQERSGSNMNELKVERALKIAVPVTCLIIALFGAPLATSSQRGGAAYGIGVSLATTMVFLMLIQLTKAVGGNGVMPPDLAAWTPSIIFGLIGLGLLARVRT